MICIYIKVVSIQVPFKSSPTFPSAESWRDRSPLSIWNEARCDTVYGIPRRRALKRAIHVMAIAMHDAGLLRVGSLRLYARSFPSILYLDRLSAHGVHYSTCIRFKTEYTPRTKSHIHSSGLPRWLDDETKIVDTPPIPTRNRSSFFSRNDGFVMMNRVVWKF